MKKIFFTSFGILFALALLAANVYSVVSYIYLVITSILTQYGTFANYWANNNLSFSATLLASFMSLFILGLLTLPCFMLLSIYKEITK